MLPFGMVTTNASLPLPSPQALPQQQQQQQHTHHQQPQHLPFHPALPMVPPSPATFHCAPSMTEPSLTGALGPSTAGHHLLLPSVGGHSHMSGGGGGGSGGSATLQGTSAPFFSSPYSTLSQQSHAPQHHHQIPVVFDGGGGSVLVHHPTSHGMHAALLSDASVGDMMSSIAHASYLSSHALPANSNQQLHHSGGSNTASSATGWSFPLLLPPHSTTTAHMLHTQPTLQHLQQQQHHSIAPSPLHSQPPLLMTLPNSTGGIGGGSTGPGLLQASGQGFAICEPLPQYHRHSQPMTFPQPHGGPAPPIPPTLGPGALLTTSAASSTNTLTSAVQPLVALASSGAISLQQHSPTPPLPGRVINGVGLEVGSTYQGVIKRLVVFRGFGFIHTDDGVDVFFHHSSLAAAKMKVCNLSIGQRVEFQVIKDGESVQATGVRVIQPTTSLSAEKCTSS